MHDVEILGCFEKKTLQYFYMRICVIFFGKK